MKHKNLLLGICFLGLFILSFRFFFSRGIIGHNWDWTFPSLDIFSGRLNISSIFTWDSYNLGKVVDLTLLHLLPNSLFVLIGKLLGIKTLLYLLFFIIIFVSFVSFKKLLDFLLGKSFLNFIPSFLYAYSPLLFNDMIGGSWVMWVAHAFCPLYFLFLVNYLENGEKRNLFISLFISFTVIISLQSFVLINLLVLFYLVYNYFLPLKTPVAQQIFKRSVLYVFLLIALNLYWIIPFSFTFLDFARTVVLAEGRVNEFDVIKNSLQSIWNIFNLSGYFDRNMYLHAIPSALSIVYQLIVAFAWFSILVFFLSEKNTNNLKKGIFWLLSLLILSLVIKGGSRPFSGFTLWLYKNFSLMRLYRSPQHLMLIPAFIIPILLALSLRFFYKYIKFQKVVLVLFLLIISIWTSGWWYNGDLGSKTLLKQGKDHVDFFTLPPKLIEYYERSERDKRDYRALFLPAIDSPDFLKTEYQNKGNGVQPEYKYLSKSTFTSEINKFANNVEMSFCHESGFDYVKYLSLFSVKDIVLRSDIYPHFTESRRCWDNEHVKQILDSTPALEKYLAGEYVTAYRVKDPYFLPHLFVASDSIYYKGGAGDLSEVVNSSDYQPGKVIFIDDPLSLNWKNYQKDVIRQAGIILIKTQVKNKIADEELETFRSQDYIELPFAAFKPGTILHSLALQREKLEVSREKQPYRIMEKRLLLANKRISELLKFAKDGTKAVDFFLNAYPEEMKVAFSAFEKMKNDNSPDFFKAFAQARSTFEWQAEQIKTAKIPDSSTILLDEVLGNINRTINGFTVEHEAKELTYELEIPKEGEYEIYTKNTEYNPSTTLMTEILNIGNTNPQNNIQYSVSNYPGWNLIETRYFSSDQQEYVLLNEFWGKNLIGDNLKINYYSPDTVYKISFKYKSLRDDSGQQPYFSVNESEAGNLFTKTLLHTGDEFENFKMLFRSSQKADRAFLLFAVPEYEDLKVEKIFLPKLLLRLKDNKDIGNQIVETSGTTPKITFIKVNPTKYRVKVEGATQPYTLVFNENFHQGWKAYLNESKNYGEIVASYFNGKVNEGRHQNIFLDWNVLETWGKKLIPEEKHFSVNGYANSWMINPEDSFGQKDYELIIEFEPQRLYYIGILASFLALIVIFGIIIINLKK